MGIADQMGWSNPFTQFVGDNRNTLMGFGAGLAGGRNFGQGVAAGLQGAQQGKMTDTLFAQQAEEKAKEEQQLNQTIEFMRSKGYGDLVSMAEAGNMPGAWAEAMQRSAPGYGQTAAEGFTLGAGQSRYDAAGNLIAQGAPDQPSYPASYQEHLLAQQDPSYAAAQAQSDAPMNSTIQKELFEAEDAVAAGGYVMSALDSAINLNKSAADGAWAGQRATIGANIPDIGIFNGDQTDQSTIQYQNIVNELALNQLKTIFGAAPTEGERKILLEIQGSVEQPRAVREQILQRAKQMAERRIAEAQAKAAGLRSGQYFQPGYGGGQQPATDGWQDMGNGVRIRPLGQ